MKNLLLLCLLDVFLFNMQIIFKITRPGVLAGTTVAIDEIKFGAKTLCTGKWAMFTNKSDWAFQCIHDSMQTHIAKRIAMNCLQYHSA